MYLFWNKSKAISVGILKKQKTNRKTEDEGMLDNI